MTEQAPVLPASKLPLPQTNKGIAVSQAVLEAWDQHMISGFRNSQLMLKSTLDAFLKPYRLTVALYAALFVVGLGLFVVAAVVGLQKGSDVVAIAFAGLGAGTFLAFFIRQPLQAIEENLECITWLGVAFNTYWTRLMYMTDPTTIQAELKAAEEEFVASVDKLITRHAELHGKRAG